MSISKNYILIPVLGIVVSFGVVVVGCGMDSFVVVMGFGVVVSVASLVVVFRVIWGVVESANRYES